MGIAEQGMQATAYSVRCAPASRMLQMQSALLKKQRLNSSLPCDLKKQYTKKTN